jgi:hypothetical protein
LACGQFLKALHIDRAIGHHPLGNDTPCASATRADVALNRLRTRSIHSAPTGKTPVFVQQGASLTLSAISARTWPCIGPQRSLINLHRANLTSGPALRHLRPTPFQPSRLRLEGFHCIGRR